MLKIEENLSKRNSASGWRRNKRMAAMAASGWRKWRNLAGCGGSVINESGAAWRKIGWRYQ